MRKARTVWKTTITDGVIREERFTLCTSQRVKERVGEIEERLRKQHGKTEETRYVGMKLSFSWQPSAMFAMCHGQRFAILVFAHVVALSTGNYCLLAHSLCLLALLYSFLYFLFYLFSEIKWNSRVISVSLNINSKASFYLFLYRKFTFTSLFFLLYNFCCHEFY